MKSCLIFLICFILFAKCSDFIFPTESDDESVFHKNELKRNRIENMTKPSRTIIGERNNFVAPIICKEGFMFDTRSDQCRKID